MSGVMFMEIFTFVCTFTSNKMIPRKCVIWGDKLLEDVPTESLKRQWHSFVAFRQLCGTHRLSTRQWQGKPGLQILKYEKIVLRMGGEHIAKHFDCLVSHRRMLQLSSPFKDFIELFILLHTLLTFNLPDWREKKGTITEAFKQ